MRRALALLGLALASALFAATSAGCSAAADDDATLDACARADKKLSACGVTLPVGQGSACVGVRRMASECVNAHADGCDELATIFQRIDACIDDIQGDAGDLVPEGVALTSHPDAGKRDGGQDGAADAGKHEGGEAGTNEDGGTL